MWLLPILAIPHVVYSLEQTVISPELQCLGRRRILKSIGAALVNLAAPAIVTRRSAAAEDRVLYVNTWGGSWTEAERTAYFNPFEKKSGIHIRTVAPVSFAKLKAQVQSRNYEWDLSNGGMVEYQQAVQEGLLEPVDFSVVSRDSLPNGMFGTHGIKAVSLAVCVVYRKDKFPAGGPRSWADFWDVARFPGNRSLYDRSFTNLAFALLADGVPADKLYPLDLDRAFRKLDEIRPHIKVWWTQGSQSQQLIRDGEVDMIAMWNARAQEMIDQGAPLEIVWDGAENYVGYWYVPKGTPRAALAWQFAEFAAQAKPQADFCNRLPYGPSNPKAFDFISLETRAKMPTSPEHLKVSFQPNAEWLAPELPRIRERWAQWMAR
jgi:putative spermidine/putrescine transport system substrate-binding protein